MRLVVILLAILAIGVLTCFIRDWLRRRSRLAGSLFHTRRNPTFGWMSIAAPFIGGFLATQVIPLSFLGVCLLGTLIPLIVLTLPILLILLLGVVFAFVAWRRHEDYPVIPLIGLVINLLAVLYVIYLFLSIKEQLAHGFTLGC